VLNASFPDIVEAVSAVPGQFVWDAELTVDTEGIPSFERLKRRAKTTSAKSIPTMVRRHPARLYVFDLLATDTDVRRRPLTERKLLLRDTFEDTETLVYVAGAVGAGNEVFALARQYGFEGMVAKRLASTYQRGRSRDWLKVRDAGYRRI
jgi:bifunctional non-homologous end joining protein LigD